MTDLTLQSTLPMRDGGAIPRLGLGVWQAARGIETRQAVLWALESGYRHVDTARIYGNEADVGEAIRASGVPRDEVFVTTKLWNDDHGYDAALRALQASLGRLGLDWVDLYLIHWPLEGLRLDSWRALVQAREDGLCRAIGVSNYLPRHLDELAQASPVMPAVNQFEMHPWLAQSDVLESCRTHDVVAESYCPLARGRRMDDPVLVRIAGKHGKTPAQVLIRWALQKDVVVIPKSARQDRIHENSDVFDFHLDGADMAALDALEAGDRIAWDPSDIP